MNNSIVKEVYIIPISGSVKVSATIYDGKTGKKYFSFRFFNLGLNNNWRPDTIKGISLELKYFGEFEKAFKALRQELIDNHLEELDKI